MSSNARRRWQISRRNNSAVTRASLDGPRSYFDWSKRRTLPILQTAFFVVRASGDHVIVAAN